MSHSTAMMPRHDQPLSTLLVAATPAAQRLPPLSTSRCWAPSSLNSNHRLPHTRYREHQYNLEKDFTLSTIDFAKPFAALVTFVKYTGGKENNTAAYSSCRYSVHHHTAIWFHGTTHDANTKHECKTKVFISWCLIAHPIRQMICKACMITMNRIYMLQMRRATYMGRTTAKGSSKNCVHMGWGFGVSCFLLFGAWLSCFDCC